MLGLADADVAIEDGLSPFAGRVRDVFVAHPADDVG